MTEDEYRQAGVRDVRTDIVGVIGVDSATLMLVDPCYIDSEWTQSERSGEALRRSVRRLTDLIASEAGLRPGEKEEREDAIIEEARVARALAEPTEYEASSLAEAHGAVSGDDQHGLCLGTSRQSGKRDARLTFPLGAVCRTGAGDGSYTVSAIVGTLEGWGERVLSMTVDFFEAEDFGD